MNFHAALNCVSQWIQESTQVLFKNFSPCQEERKTQQEIHSGAIKSIIFQRKDFFDCISQQLDRKNIANFAEAIQQISYSRIKKTQSQEKIKQLRNDCNTRLTKRIKELFFRRDAVNIQLNEWLSKFAISHPNHIMTQQLVELTTDSMNSNNDLPNQLIAVASKTKSIEALNLQNCTLNIELLKAIKTFEKLKRLQIKASNCSDWDIQFIGENIPQLEELKIENTPENNFNLFTGRTFKTLPDTLNTLVIVNMSLGFKHNLNELEFPKGIEKLTLQRYKLGNSCCSKMNQLSNLTELDLSNAELLYENIEFFPKTLHKLNLSRCMLDDQACSQLSKFENLKELNVDYNFFTGDNFKLLPTSLESLACTHAWVKDEIFSQLAEHKNLKKLFLFDNQFLTGKGLSNLPNSIEILDLGGLNLTDESLQELEQFTNLKQLSLNWNGKFSAEGMKSLPESIEVLDLERCVKITSNVCEYLKRLTRLKELNIAGTYGEYSDQIKHLPKSIIDLTIGSSMITDETIKKFAMLSNLESLNLQCCSITDNGVASLPRTLKKIELSYPMSITDEIWKILSTFPFLEALYLYNCTLPGKGVSHLPETVKKLHIINCGLSIEAIKELKKRPTLNEFYYE